MQFALYYVFWPFFGGAGFCYFGIMDHSFMWWFLAFWFLPWIIWPVGKYRRRYMLDQIEAATKEVKESGEGAAGKALALGLGPTIVMILAGILGTYFAPVYMEAVLGIDVQAHIEEIQKDVGQRETD